MSQLSGAQVGALLAAHPNVAVIVTTFEGRVVFWNRGAEALFGYEREEAVGGSIADLIVPVEGLDSQRAALRRAADGGSTIFTAERRTKEGRRVAVVVSLDVARSDHRETRYVIATCRDERLVSPRVGLAPEGAQAELEAPPDTVALPQRQRQVLLRIADGLTTREIAERLGLSPKTIETHRSRLMRRLRARNLAELLRRALELGLVQIGPRGGVPAGAERRSRAAK
jgi:PAS domain S-box-containing protein